MSRSLLSGLSSTRFHGIDSIQRVQCSGDTLPADSKILFAVLYQVSDGKILGKMSMTEKQCYTSEEFVSCDISEGETKESKMRILVADLGEGQSREFGCNVTALMAGFRTRFFSWSLVVRHVPRKSVSLGAVCVAVLHYHPL